VAVVVVFRLDRWRERRNSARCEWWGYATSTSDSTWRPTTLWTRSTTTSATWDRLSTDISRTTSSWGYHGISLTWPDLTWQFNKIYADSSGSCWWILLTFWGVKCSGVGICPKIRGQVSQVKPSNCFGQLEKSVLPFYLSFWIVPFVLDMKLAVYPTTVLNERMWHFMGSKRTLTLLQIFRG